MQAYPPSTMFKGLVQFEEKEKRETHMPDVPMRHWRSKNNDILHRMLQSVFYSQHSRHQQRIVVQEYRICEGMPTLSSQK